MDAATKYLGGFLSVVFVLWSRYTLQAAIMAAVLPFTYAQIVFAALMSWLFFNNAPDIWAWLGMAMIAASGGATAWLTIRRKS